MLHKFYKAFFFVSLIITALIAVTIMYGDTSRIFIDIFTNGYGEILADVPAFLPICATVLCILLALLVGGVIHFIQKNKEVALTPSKRNFFLFYFISLTVVSLLVLLFYLLRSDMYDRCIDNYDVIVFALIYGACVIEALVLAAFLVSFFTLWKTNKPVAYIIGVIIVLITLANIISGQAIYEASSRCNATYRAAYNQNKNIDSSHYDSDDEVEADDDYEDVIGIVDDYLSFLWDEDDDIDAALEYLFTDRLDWGSVYSEHLLTNIEFLSYRLRSSDKDWNDYYRDYYDIATKTLRNAYHYLKQTPSAILDAFFSYEDVIYRCMPISEFHNTAADQLLKQLTVAYNDLYSDNGLNRLQSIYIEMDDSKHDFAWEYYDDIKPHIDDDYLHYFYDRDGDFLQNVVVWAYSFWARRNAEGTDNIAYRILSHLNEHYIEEEE